MDDMYNNDQNSQYQNNQYQNTQYDNTSYQQGSVQQQLQYQYQGPQTELEEPVTMGEWMISLLIMLIPCANIVMMFVWAFSSKEKKSKSNFFKAALIYGAIVIVLEVIFFMVLGASFASIGNSYYY